MYDCLFLVLLCVFLRYPFGSNSLTLRSLFRTQDTRNGHNLILLTLNSLRRFAEHPHHLRRLLRNSALAQRRHGRLAMAGIKDQKSMATTRQDFDAHNGPRVALMLQIQRRREGLGSRPFPEVLQNPLEQFKMRSVLGGGCVEVQQLRLDLIGREESHDLGSTDPFTRVD